MMNRVVVERLLDACPQAERFVWAAWICGGVYLGCTLIRLARFNVENVHEEEAHRSFKGLPSPAAAGAMVAYVIVVMARFEPVRDDVAKVTLPGPCATVLLWVAPLIAVLLGLLMVSRIRYLHLLNVIIRGRRPISHLVLIVLLIALGLLLASVLKEAILLVGFGAYVLSGPVLGLWRLVAGKRQGKAGPPDLFNQPPAGPAAP